MRACRTESLIVATCLGLDLMGSPRRGDHRNDPETQKKRARLRAAKICGPSTGNILACYHILGLRFVK
jgi:hypothetical protein